jgi:hypothetical protein
MVLQFETLACVQMFQIGWSLHGLAIWNFGLCTDVSNWMVLQFETSACVQMFQIEWSLHGLAIWNFGMCTGVSNWMVFTCSCNLKLWPVYRCFKLNGLYMVLQFETLACVHTFQIEWSLHGLALWNFGLCTDVSNKLVIMWSCILKLWPMYSCFKYTSYYMTWCFGTLAFLQMF